MNIVIDEAVTAGAAAFSRSGIVRSLPGVEIARSDLAEVDALVVRTALRIDDALLDRAPRLRFVGSASAGVDHVDIDALRRRDVTFAHAPGCNAAAVAQWVFAALVARHAGFLSGGATVGIVGAGQVGTRLAVLVVDRGHRIMRCDPPRARRGDPGPWFSLDDVLREADVVSVHVPLTAAGRDSTAGLVDHETLAYLLARGATFVNTSRGEVVHHGAFASLPRSGQLILDVFRGEPDLPWQELARPGSRVDLASPHVAGYSARAKLRATAAIAHALAEFTGGERAADLPILTPVPVQLGVEESVSRFIPRVAGIEREDAWLRVLAGKSDVTDAPAAFRRRRANFALRPEWCDVLVRGAAPGVRSELARLGFRHFG